MLCYAFMLCYCLGRSPSRNLLTQFFFHFLIYSFCPHFLFKKSLAQGSTHLTLQNGDSGRRLRQRWAACAMIHRFDETLGQTFTRWMDDMTLGPARNLIMRPTGPNPLSLQPFDQTPGTPLSAWSSIHELMGMTQP